eukprot:375719-Rhodomonas_salina.3
MVEMVRGGSCLAGKKWGWGCGGRGCDGFRGGWEDLERGKGGTGERGRWRDEGSGVIGVWSMHRCGK